MLKLFGRKICGNKEVLGVHETILQRMVLDILDEEKNVSMESLFPLT